MSIIAWLNANVLLLILLMLLVIVVTLIITIVMRVRRDREMSFEISIDVEDQIRRGLLGASNEIKQFHDVVAILQLMQSLNEQPDALEKIKSYPAQVQAASWMHYVDTLGVALKHAQDELSRAHKGEKFDFYSSPQDKIIEYYQTRVDLIRNKLTAAVKASGQPMLHAV